jgi:hypothetical protein
MTMLLTMFLISSTDLLPILGINAELLSRWLRNGWVVPIAEGTGHRGGPARFSLIQAWGMCCGAALHYAAGGSYRFMESMAKQGNIPRRYDVAKEAKTRQLLLEHGPFEPPEPGANMALVENESWAKLAPILERLRLYCLARWAEEPPANGSSAGGAGGEAVRSKRQPAGG